MTTGMVAPMYRVLALVAVLPLGVAACGDNSVACGPGTYLDLTNRCVPFDPNDKTAPTTTATPAAGRTRALSDHVTLTADEPATIYFTRDGSEPTTDSPSEPSPVTLLDPASGETIKFFAVDGAGNQESPQTLTYVVDIDGPAPVKGLVAALNGTTITLTWTNPTTSDFAGVLVARSTNGVVASSPVPGKIYTTAEMMPTGEKILLASNATTVTDTFTGNPGDSAVWTAWAYDDLGNYSQIAVSNRLRVPLPAQTGTISIALATGVVTVTGDPSGLTLSGTAQRTGNNLDITLNVQNDASRLLFALKGVVTAQNQGTVTSGTTLFTGKPMIYFGPNALAPAASVSRQFQLGGIDGTVDPVTVSLSFVDNPMIYMSHAGVDVSGGGPWFQTNIGNGRGAAVSHDGRSVYTGDKAGPIVRVFDTVTATAQTRAVSFTGSIAGVAVSPARNDVYAVYGSGHWNGGNGTGDGGPWTPTFGDTTLLVLDPTTLSIKSSLPITSVSGEHPRGIFISPSGGRAIIPVSLNCNGKDDVNDCADATPAATHHNILWVVDLDNLKVIDTDPAMAGVQGIDIGTTRIGVFSGHAAWSPDESAFYVGLNAYNIGVNKGPSVEVPLVKVDMNTYALSDLAAASEATSAGGVVATNTKVYYVGRQGSDNTKALSVFTGSVETNPTLSFNVDSAGGIVFDPSGLRYYVNAGRNAGALAVFDAATDQQVDIDGASGNGVTAITINNGNSPHSIAITPF